MIRELRNLMTSFPCLGVNRKSVNLRRAGGRRPNNLRKRSSVLIASGRNRESVHIPKGPSHTCSTWSWNRGEPERREHVDRESHRLRHEGSLGARPGAARERLSRIIHSSSNSRPPIDV